MNADLEGNDSNNGDGSRGRARRKSFERLTGFQVGFHILLALADGPAHGAAITRQIVGDTLGLHIGGATLYDELGRLERAGLHDLVMGGRLLGG